MPSVGHLNGFGCTLANAVGVGAGAVAGDDRHPGVRLQPRGDGVGLAVGQQVDGAVALEIDDDGAVALATTPCPIIDPDDARRWGRLHGHRPNQAQQRVAADRHGEPGGQPGTGFSARAQRDIALRLGEPAGSPNPGRCHGGQAFGEDAARAIHGHTPEPADLKVEFTHATLPGTVAQATAVPAVDAEGRSTAQRTRRRGGTHMSRHNDPIGIDGDPVDDKAGREQRKQ